MEISEWVEAARVAHTMAHNHLGCMGHYYSVMLDIYKDLTLQYKYFGGYIELIEVEELVTLRKQVSSQHINGSRRFVNERNGHRPAHHVPLALDISARSFLSLASC